MAQTRLSALLIFFLAGCAPSLPSFDPSPKINIPTDIDHYLAESEKRIPGLKQGTEKSIRWYQGTKKKTPYSIVYFHGFSASRRESSPVVEQVADALGANVFFTRLKGHGIEGVDALAEARTEDWIQDAWEAFEIGKRIGNQVILIGMSMGAVSAVQLAIRSNDVAAVVLLAPYFGWSRWLIDIGRSPLGLELIRLKLGDTRSFKYLNERHKYFWTTTYRIEALQPLFTMGAIQRATDLGQLTKRTLVFYSKKDEFLNFDDVEKRFLKIGSGIKRLVHLDEATEHVITGDIVSPKTVPVVTQETIRFLKSLRD